MNSEWPKNIYEDRFGISEEDDLLTIKTLEALNGGGNWTMYLGVIVAWDEDHDERVLGFLDEMPEHDREFLVGIKEHEGSIDVVWLYNENLKYTKYTSHDAPGPDCWSVNEVYVLSPQVLEKKYSSYSDALKSPKWQRKRLEIMQRDNFQCQYCMDTETTLHVHHTCYITGFNPWDYDDASLVTLCENCHKAEHGRA